MVGYAVITLMPLLWIVATGFKSPADSIAYPPKVVFEPTVEGYVNLFTTAPGNAEICSTPQPHDPWYEEMVREQGTGHRRAVALW